MNSLVDDYLVYVSSAISNYLEILLKSDENIALDKMTDIIYDYLNEVFLLDKKIESYNFDSVLNFKLKSNENSLFNLFIEYGLIDRIKLKDKNIKKSYVFVVDTINYFINIHRYIYKGVEFFYNQISQKVLRNASFIDKDYLKEILSQNDKVISSLVEKNVDCIKKIKIVQDSFDYNLQKISNNMFFLKTYYSNILIKDYNKQESDFVLKDYQKELYLNSLENLSIKILLDLFEGKKNQYFVFVPDYIVKSKLTLNKISKLFNLYAVANCVCFLFESDIYNKYKEVLELFENYNTAIYITTQSDYDADYDSINYMIVQFEDDLNDFINKYNKTCEIIINGRINSIIKKELTQKDIKYFCNIRVVS